MTSEGTFYLVNQARESDTSWLSSVDGGGSVCTWGPCCQPVGIRGPEGRRVLERQRGFSPPRAPRDLLHMCHVGIPTPHSTALNAEPSSTQASRTLWKFQLPQSSTPHVGPSTGVTLRPADGCIARSEPRVSPLCSHETQNGSSAPTFCRAKDSEQPGCVGA